MGWNSKRRHGSGKRKAAVAHSGPEAGHLGKSNIVIQAVDPSEMVKNQLNQIQQQNIKSEQEQEEDKNKKNKNKNKNKGTAAVERVLSNAYDCIMVITDAQHKDYLSHIHSPQNQVFVHFIENFNLIELKRFVLERENQETNIMWVVIPGMYSTFMIDQQKLSHYKKEPFKWNMPNIQDLKENENKGSPNEWGKLLNEICSCLGPASHIILAPPLPIIIKSHYMISERGKIKSSLYVTSNSQDEGQKVLDSLNYFKNSYKNFVKKINVIGKKLLVKQNLNFLSGSLINHTFIYILYESCGIAQTYVLLKGWSGLSKWLNIFQNLTGINVNVKDRTRVPLLKKMINDNESQEEKNKKIEYEADASNLLVSDEPSIFDQKQCMAGHSKWSNIRQTEGAEDQQEATLFAKMADLMRLAIRENKGNNNPKTNTALARAIEMAKGNTMPVAAIERVLASANIGDTVVTAQQSGGTPAGAQTTTLLKRPHVDNAATNATTSVKQTKYEIPSGENAVSILHKQFRGRINFVEKSVGNIHVPEFECSVEVDGQTFHGLGKNKKAAKNEAAETALLALMQIDDIVVTAQQSGGTPAGAQTTTLLKRPHVDNAATNATTSVKQTKYEIPPGKNAVSILHKKCRGRINFVEKSVGNIQVPEFECSVEVDGQTFHGLGKNKKAAKNEAAETALLALMQIGNTVVTAQQSGGTPAWAQPTTLLKRPHVDNAATNETTSVKQMKYEIPPGENAIYILNKQFGGRINFVKKFVGNIHVPEFECSFEVDGQTFQGLGKTKNAAKYKAAETAVLALMQDRFVNL